MTSGQARIVRFTLLGLVLAGILAAWRWRHLFDPLSLSGWVGASWAAPPTFLALHIAASLFFVPRTLLALGAGMVFGMWWGIGWAALGSVAGAIAGFLFARYIQAGLGAFGWYAGLANRAGPARVAAVMQRVENGGWRAVAVVRLVPIIPHSLTNYVLGLTRVRLGAFALGSLLGQLPLTIAYAELGAAGNRALLGGDWRHEVLWPSLIGFGALLLSLLVPALIRRRSQQPAAAPTPLPRAMPGA